MPDEPRTFGRYILHEKIGQGGMGTVFRAEDPSLGRSVALKVLTDRGDAQAIERFEREARAIARLRHPGIVAIHDWGEAGGERYFTMDLIDGTGLADRRLPSRAAAQIVRDAARAVHHAHSQGIIHRDLKPANILVDSAGRAVVGDFGLARSRAAPTSISATGWIIGTPAFLSPEQARGDRAIDARSDVYALGATLHALISGRAPFDRDALPDIIAAVLSDPPPPLEAPPDLAAIAHKAMEKDPARRYGTALELADDLARWLDGESVRARPPGPLRRISLAVARRPGLSAAVASGAGAVVLACALLLPPWLRRDEELRVRARIKPHEEAVAGARAYFYIPGDDIFAKLDRAREAVAALDVMARDPATARSVDVWRALAEGATVLGDLDRAEEALLACDRLSPGDGWVQCRLGRLCLERAAEELLAVNERGPGSSVGRWTQRALDWFTRPSTGWTGAAALDRHVAQAWRALAENRKDEVQRLCRQGIDRFGEEAVGTEELWCLLALASADTSDKIELYTQAIGRRPHYAWALAMRSGLRRRTDPAALADADAALRLNPRLVVAHSCRGHCLFDRGDLDGAIAAYSEALRLRPGYFWSRINRAMVLHRKGEYDRALADLDEALRHPDAAGLAHTHRAAVRSSKGDHKGAIEDADEAIRVAPDYADAWYNRGRMRKRAGDADGATADFSEAIRLDPGHVDAHAYRGELRQRAGDHADAIKDLDVVLRARPGNITAWTNRAAAHVALRDYKSALQDAEHAVDIDAGNANARHTRGHVKLLLRDLDGAIADLAEAARLRPDEYTLLLLGQAHTDRGDFPRAEEHFAAALRLDPNMVDAYVRRAWARKSRLNFEGAIDDLTEVLRLDPGNVSARYNRGSFRRTLGQLDNAIADFTELLRARPDHVDAWRLRGNCHFERKDYRKAEADYAKALEVAPPDWSLRAVVERALKAARENP